MLLPLVAMQFTDEVKWDGADFAFLGALLLGVGGSYELLASKNGSTAYRAAVGVALAGAFLLVWINAAVGIIGSENNDANLMFGGVLAVGVIGAILARFQPAGMARDLFATALAQVVVALIALISGAGAGAPKWPIDLLVLTGFFAALWLASAMLFRRAAREQTPANAAA
jgi:ABC-type Na+ efflux pump permease subunit